MQEEQPQQDTSAAPQVDAAPGSAVPESATPATPAHEEADAASGQPDSVGQTETEDPSSPEVSEEDVAPDADEPGDDVAPEELEQQVQDAPDEPDNVDREG